MRQQPPWPRAPGPSAPRSKQQRRACFALLCMLCTVPDIAAVVACMHSDPCTAIHAEAQPSSARGLFLHRLNIGLHSRIDCVALGLIGLMACLHARLPHVASYDSHAGLCVLISHVHLVLVWSGPIIILVRERCDVCDDGMLGMRTHKWISCAAMNAYMYGQLGSCIL